MVTGALSAAVEDRGSLFSAKAVAAANEQLGKVRTATGKEIVILTVNDLGGKKIADFARDEGRSRQLNGIIVLISKNPRQLEIVAGRKTSLVFRKEHRDKVIEILGKNLRKTPDEALATTVKYIADTFGSANSALIVPESRGSQMPVQQRQSGSYGWVKWLIIIGIIFLVIRLISYLMTRNSAANTGMPGQGGSPSGFGGGGFFSSLMGGIFGAVAGNWIYNQFFGDSHDHSNYNQNSNYDSNQQDWRNDDRGDFDSGSGSGGDWGGDSGGSDGGGGGGDSGGGDW